MCAMQRDPYQRWNQPPQQQPPQPPAPRYRFRWPVYFWLPLVMGALLWFISGIDLPFRFYEITEALHIRHTERYELLASLGILCVSALLIIKVLQKK